VCHVLRNHGELGEYFGPRFMVRYQYLAMHPKDILDRRGAVKHKGGIGLCNITKCCQEVCPEHIHITDNSIIPLKERVADVSFDPVRWAARKLSGSKMKPQENLEGSGTPDTSRTTHGKDIAAS
jgi:succinate dehydrogenase / fumarate reductase iron-sulfur subunit